jgi:hypothetical protein
MEFVIVTWEGPSRPVFIDDQNQGVTGNRLSVPEGFHVFDLGLPKNYKPSSREIDVRNTTPTEPMPIPFVLKPTVSLAEGRKARGKSRRKKSKARRSKSKPRTAKAKRRASPKRKTSRKSTRARKKK